MFLEINWIGSLIIPLLVAGITSIITFLIARKKTNAEVKKLQVDTQKAESEIDNLKIENEKLKKSFQPLVINTLNNVQNTILRDKLKALQKLVETRNELIAYQDIYDGEDEVRIPDYDEFLEQVFVGFSTEKFKSYREFYHQFGHLFPDDIYEQLGEGFNHLAKFEREVDSYSRNWDQGSVLGKTDREFAEKSIEFINESIKLIRKDCHLDSKFIHDFIEENK